MQVRFSFPMLKRKLKSKQEEDSQNMSLINSSKSPVRITRRNGLSPFDSLVKQCEILSRKNLSGYDNCVKLQEKLRLHLTNHSTNDDYKYLKSWLGRAREDYITMESNYGDLKDIYEVLLKNDFVEKFYDYGETLDKLQFKFLKVMVQCKDLQKSLNTVEDDITSLKLEYTKSPTTENSSNRYANHQKTLRLKAINVIYECERLKTCLQDTCEKILELNSEFDNLIGRYTVLSENTIVKEFLDSANQQENPEMKSINKFNTDKICRMLLNHQRLFLPNGKTESCLTNIESIRNSVKKESGSGNTTVVAEFSSSTTLRTNISEFQDTTEQIDFGDSIQGENLFTPHTVFMPDDTNDENVDFSLDSGITAVGNSTELDASSSVEKVTDFRCDVCNGYYESQQSLEDHKRVVHEGHKPYKCFVCGKSFDCRSNMKKHLTQFHRRVYSESSSAKKPHKCSMCPMRFKHYRLKTFHQRQAHELGDTEN